MRVSDKQKLMGQFEGHGKEMSILTGSTGSPAIDHFGDQAYQLLHLQPIHYNTPSIR